LSLPSTPASWADFLSEAVSAALGPERFPVDVAELAILFTQEIFEDPITRVVGEPLDGFEGALFPSPSGRPRWLIVYNSALTSKGRIRFIQAHELGHYLLHRQPGQSIRCRTEDTWIWDPAYQRQEAEANLFASCLLMPLADYSGQVAGQQIDLDLFKRCAARYGVSLTAAILKWLEFTPVAAVLVCSCDGFINWAVSSKPAMRAGAFFRTRGCRPIPVPEASLAALPPANLGPAARVDHPHGVWFASLPATEFAMTSWRYDMTLSLLVLREAVSAARSVPRFRGGSGRSLWR
jgi:IrrE N-terminal-like domain